ncbi:MAG: acyltransferase [Xanthobacteraceae bacterium]
MAIRENLPALTGLRFVAALCVLLAHAVNVFLDRYTFINWLEYATNFGMTLFFVLSGFVIHYNYGPSIFGGRVQSSLAYLWARFARLYPLYLLMLIIYVALSSHTLDLWHGDATRFFELLDVLPYFLFSLQSWFYIPINATDTLIDGIGGGSPLTWSISTEWFFYLAYFVIGAIVFRLRRPALAFSAVIVWITACLTTMTILSGFLPEIDGWAMAHFGPVASMRSNWQDSFVRWLLYLAPYVRAGEFILGALVAQLYLTSRERTIAESEQRFGRALGYLAIASVPLLTYVTAAPTAPANALQAMGLNFGLAASAATLVYTFVRYKSVAASLLSANPVIALGDASYSIYLTHYVVVLGVSRIMPANSLALALLEFVASVVVALMVSLWLYRYYEAPMRRWLRAVPFTDPVAGVEA